MIRARKKAGVITVAQVVEGQELPLNTYTNDAGQFFVRNALHNSVIEVKVGDYVRVDNPGDTYPIDASYFAENYEVIE